MTAFDVNDGDATLAFYEGSHQFHKEFAQHFNITNKGDWFKLENDEQSEFYKNKGCVERYIKCPKGGFVYRKTRISGKMAGIRDKSGIRNIILAAYRNLVYQPKWLVYKT